MRFDVHGQATVRSDVCSLALALGVALLPSAALAATELWLRPQAEDGSVVLLSKAEVFLDTWYESRRVALASTERGVKVPLDRTWLCVVWPERCSENSLEARILLHASDCVPVSSKLFVWPGGWNPSDSSSVIAAEIRFPGGRSITVPQHAVRELIVPMRKPQERFVRLVDGGGQPVAGVRVTTYLFLASSSHCGVLEGEVLGQALSDREGRTAVPDGDIEYGFQFEQPHVVLSQPRSSYYPSELVTELSARETTIAMRRNRREPLTVRVRVSGGIAPRAVLAGCLAGCACGTCCDDVATADENGRIDLTEFYPEEYERLSISDERGNLWEGSPDELVGGVREVEIRPSSTRR